MIPSTFPEKYHAHALQLSDAALKRATINERHTIHDLDQNDARLRTEPAELESHKLDDAEQRLLDFRSNQIRNVKNQIAAMWPASLRPLLDRAHPLPRYA